MQAELRAAREAHARELAGRDAARPTPAESAAALAAKQAEADTAVAQVGPVAGRRNERALFARVFCLADRVGGGAGREAGGGGLQFSCLPGMSTAGATLRLRYCPGFSCRLTCVSSRICRGMRCKDLWTRCGAVQRPGSRKWLRQLASIPADDTGLQRDA